MFTDNTWSNVNQLNLKYYKLKKNFPPTAFIHFGNANLYNFKLKYTLPSKSLETP